MARIRSPNYPALSLPEAISRVKTVYEKEQHLAAPKNVIAKHLGYSSISGPSLTTLSALNKYGLIEEAGKDKIRVSQLAVSILHPSNADEKANAIREAAFKPELFAEISSEWGGQTPSDENLKSYLLKKNFALEATKRVIESYKATIELVTHESMMYPVNNGVSAPKIQEEPPMMSAPQQVIQSQNAPMSVSILGDKIQVSATLIDKESVEKLISTLNATKVLLPG